MDIKRFARPALALALAGSAFAAPHAHAAEQEDQVAASFQRMLNHETSRVAPPAPQSTGEDQLRTAVNAVIWRTQPRSFHIAAAAAQPDPALRRKN